MQNLHTRVPLRRTLFNRLFALLYTCTIFALFYHHFLNVYNSGPKLTSLLMVLADVVLAFLWITYQGYRISPVHREVFPENLPKDERVYPGLDIFICTADPYKEPPMGVASTALSVMAYDYPAEKLSVYISDDGGSELTLFAFMEAAKFARHWLPYCRKYNIVERCPKVYFKLDPALFPEYDTIKLMYESMKIRVENAVERGSVPRDDISDELAIQAFSKWTDQFVRQDHPTVIQVLLESDVDKDIAGNSMPNLIYVSREKSRVTPHHFKAGALNVLLRVSSTMTNAPIFLVLDCDMYSNDPKTPLQALCFLMDPWMDQKLAFVQYPQLFQGIDKDDIYGAACRHLAEVYPPGLDGFGVAPLMGTGCFFRKRIFFGGPSSTTFEIPELRPHDIATKPIRSASILEMAHSVAGCNYEAQTKWGSELGFRYGSLVEDFYTGFRLQCDGWKSVFYSPTRAAFLGSAPMTLYDSLNQFKRWSMGLLDVGLCKYNPITFGLKFLKLWHALCVMHFAFWTFWAVPVTIYAFLPQLALLHSVPMFPKVTDPWFFLYLFLFIGTYVQDFLEFILAGGTARRWWNHQRMWLIRGISSYPFALVECVLDFFNLSTFGFNVTSKVIDIELSKRYEKGFFEFGVSSEMFLTISMAALVNLLSFVSGIGQLLKNGWAKGDGLFVQMFISGFVVANSWPVYEAMVLRSDEGKMPVKITLLSIACTWLLYQTSSVVF